MSEKRRLGTKAEYVEHRKANGHKCSKPYLSKPEVSKRLEPATLIDPADGKVKLDFDLADKIFETTGDPSRKLPTAAEKKSDSVEPAMQGFTYVKTERERVKLEKERLEHEERLGSTLSLSRTEHACVNVASQIRDELFKRNRRMAEDLSTMTDPREIRTYLDTSVRTLLKGLSDDFMRKLSLASEGDVQTH